MSPNPKILQSAVLQHTVELQLFCHMGGLSGWWFSLWITNVNILTGARFRAYIHTHTYTSLLYQKVKLLSRVFLFFSIRWLSSSQNLQEISWPHYIIPKKFCFGKMAQIFWPHYIIWNQFCLGKVALSRVLAWETDVLTDRKMQMSAVVFLGSHAWLGFAFEERKMTQNTFCGCHFLKLSAASQWVATMRYCVGAASYWLL